MKTLLTYSIISFFLFIAGITYYVLSPKPADTTNIIKHYYFVTSVHNDYIEVQSDKYKNEYINLYYSDQVTKDTFSIGDKVAAYFQTDKGKTVIVDFKKVTPSPDEQMFKQVSFKLNN